MWPPVGDLNAVAVGIGTRQDHSRAMEGKSSSLSIVCLLGFVLLSGLHSTVAVPSFDPPQLYPEGLRRSADPSIPEIDDSADSQPAAPAAEPIPNPLPPFMALKTGLAGASIDPSQILQMKADFLKNLLGPGGIKSPVARAAAPSKWSSAAWSSGSSSQSPPAASASKYASKSKSKAPAKDPAPANSFAWSWAPTSAPAAPAAPVYYPVQAPAPAPVPVYYAPPTPAPTPAVDKKTALLEALLDQYIAPAPSSRFARAPLGSASPAPSPYLTNLLDSLNVTLPTAPPTLKPTIEPPGFWFPSMIPAPPGSLYPFVADPTAMVAKKSKFLSDLFTSKAAAAMAASSAPAPSVAARAIDDDYTSKVANYLNSILDSTSGVKRAAPIPKKSVKAKPVPKPAKAAKPTNPPVIEEDEVPEDEAGLNEFLGLRGKREIGDDSEADASTEIDVASVAAKSAALLNDMATIKQSIILQLDAMSKAESAASKATKLAAKAAQKASTIAGVLKLPTPPPAVLPAPSLADFQQKISTLTNLYATLSDTQKNITSAPDASDPLNPDKLFIAAVNAKVANLLVKNALLSASVSVPKVARSTNWHKSHEQNSGNSQQYESGNESNRHVKSAAPLVAAVFAPQSYHFKEPNAKWN